jgi:hypothetical protein
MEAAERAGEMAAPELACLASTFVSDLTGSNSLSTKKAPEGRPSVHIKG